MDSIEVSVIVLTYHPDWEKLEKTLRSVLLQKNIALEIVVADDGSPDSCTDQMESLFRSFSFERYRLLHAEENQGTCANFLMGIRAARGRYVRAISPGDFLNRADVLSDWLHYVEEKGIRVSFGDGIYYRLSEGKYQIIRRKVSDPVVKSVYDHAFYRRRMIKLYNFMMKDWILGATFLTERALAEQYCAELVAGKVIYLEDAMYKLMILDDIEIAHYPADVVFYEYGTGISTSKTEAWNERLRADQRSLEHIVIHRKPLDAFSARYAKLLKREAKNGKSSMLGRILRFPDMLLAKLLKSFVLWTGISRSSGEYDHAFIDGLRKE